MAEEKNMSSDVMIQIRGLKKSYGKLEVLRGIDLDVKRGEKVVILGPSGSGKSTLLRCINALEEADSGSILVDGIEVTSRRTNLNHLREHLGMVFQRFNLWPHLTVIENVMIGQVVVGHKSKAEAREKALAMLDRVGLKDRADEYPVRLSGGQQQRVGIARAFVAKPKIVFADEPTGNLDTKTTKEVMELMVRLCRKNNQTLVLVTHDRELALYADRIITLIDGKVVDDRENRSIAEISEEPSETAALPENTSASKALQSSQDDEMAQVVNALLPDDLQEQPKQLSEVVDEKPEEMEEKQEITDQEREDEEKQ